MPPEPDPPEPDPPEPPQTRGKTEDLAGTSKLLPLARAGDRAAQQALFERHAPDLQRLLHARLPSHVRGLLGTDDLVQEVFSRTLARIASFDYRGPGSFWCYLRRIGLNYVSEVVRRHEPGKAPRAANGSTLDAADSRAGPISEILRQERFGAFERALETLPDQQRQAVLMRIELRFPFEAIAAECGYKSPDAARMAVKRGLVRLTERMSHDGFEE